MSQPIIPPELLAAAAGWSVPDGLTIYAIQGIIAAADDACADDREIRQRLRWSAIARARLDIQTAALELTTTDSQPTLADIYGINDVLAGLDLAASIAFADGDRAAAEIFRALNGQVQDTIHAPAFSKRMQEFLGRMCGEPSPSTTEDTMNTISLAQTLSREAVENAEERADQARIEWLAVRDTDEEGPAYRRWQEALHELRFAGL